MPRPKSFDVDEVIDRAVELFWVNGYAATSMEDLVTHLGINRGSLYATFGSKQELYEQAFERYADGGRDWLAGMVNDRTMPLGQAVRAVLTSAAETTDHRGCLLVNTAMERNAADERCLRLSSLALDSLRTVLSTAFEARQDELASGVSAGEAADLVLVAMQGLRVLASTESAVDAGPTIDSVVGSVVADAA